MQQTNDTTETTTTETEASDGLAPPEPEIVDSLSDLLRAEDPEGNEQERLLEIEGEDSETKGLELDVRASAEKFQSSKFNDAAEALGLDLDSLYQLEVTTSEDGEPVTIEQLKDAWSGGEQLQVDRLAFEEERSQKEAKLLQAQTELRGIMEELPPGTINEKTLARIRQKHEATVAIERERTLEAIPAWQDEEVREKDVRGMVEQLGRYGLPTSWLGGVTDHHLIAYIRDSYLREQRVNAALARVKPGTAANVKPSKPAEKAPERAPVAGAKKGNQGDPLKSILLD